MITVQQNTTLIGVSELRTKMEQLLKKLPGTKVVIEKRHKPIAILMSNEEYEKTEQLLEMAEDIVLGYLAKSRYENTKEKEYIDIEEVLKKLGH
jgi:PHD/YefM family antitoxin component YafN of YafNO toxin-antitoxin module